MASTLALLHWIAPLCAALIAYGVMEGDDDDGPLQIARMRRVFRIGLSIAVGAWCLAAIVDAMTWAAMTAFARFHNGVMLVVGIGAITILAFARRHYERDVAAAMGDRS